ncbi:MAG: 23S rRNA (adenine(2503)-C(2))-methyltransferase RlmN [Candidatus Omnitrophota bacterium]
MKEDIKNLSLPELESYLTRIKQPRFHAHQIFSWVYQKKVEDFTLMSNLPQDLRQRLKEEFSCCGLKIIEKHTSRDGTEKFLFALKDNNTIEAVRIPAAKRITGCISSQAGCKFGCMFCASASSGFKRNLACAEMLDELMRLGALTHVVFMGTGEPLDNYDNVLRAVRMINAPEGFNIGARRITISTCGIIPGIERLAEENLQIELSISLHAADEFTRSRLVPINKKYPLNKLLSCCREYIRKTNRQVTFEYILIKGVNADLQHAGNLAKLLKPLKLCKVNLIPANAVVELKIAPPPEKEIRAFTGCLLKAGVNATLRKPRGQDIQAACGQLRHNYAKN